MKRFILTLTLIVAIGLTASLSWGGPWLRQWSDAAESGSTLPGSARCAVCHGDFASGWRAGVMPDHNRPGLLNTANHRTCEICHVLPAAPYDWFTDHDTQPHVIDINSNPELNYDPATGSCNMACHDNNPPYVLGTSPGFANSGIAGPGPPCTACHGDDSGPNPGRIWPDGVDNNPIRVAAIDDETGAHDNHVGSIGSYLGFGPDISAYSRTDQIEICGFCHPNPGGPGHATDNAPAGRVDVHGAGSFLRYTVLAAGYATDATAAAYDYSTRGCSNLVCHNQSDTPTGASDWNNPPDWSSGLDARCSATSCHSTASYTQAHTTHTSIQRWSTTVYDCQECHGDNGADLRHQDGSVAISFTTNGTLEQTFGGGDGYYDKDGSASPSGGDASFAYKDGNYARTCYNIYCHGDDGLSNGTDTTPEWNDPATATCQTGTCHGAYGSEYNQSGGQEPELNTGSHWVHFEKRDNTGAIIPDRGPQINRHPSSGSSFGCGACHNITLSCNGCHLLHGGGATMPNLTHADGRVDFRDVDAEPMPTIDDPGTSLSVTQACDNCHSTATVNGQIGAELAKANWGSPTFRSPCLTCHNGADPGTQHAGGTGLAAPDMLGDDAIYGAEIGGHSKTSGGYASGNTAAGRDCIDCHSEDSSHINGVNDSGVAGDRLDTRINAVGPLATVDEVCGACHQSSGGSTLNVASHGNINGTFTAGTTHDANAEPFAYRCGACHEPHGLTLNGRTATSTNIYMVKGRVEVMNYSTPGSGATTTDQITMVFEAKTGANSFDDGATPVNNLCVQCHQNATRPGSGTGLLSVDGDHAGLDEFQGNEQGNDCTGCHQHDYDANVSTTDGFMPLQCDDCHEDPPASGAHLAHVGTGASQYGFDCGRCHSGNLHNEAGVLGAAGYNAASLTISNLIDVNFDTLNPAGTYTPAKGSRVAAGTGTCTALYCHGMAPPQAARWDSTGSVSCGTCHGDGTGRPAAPPSGGSHQTPSHQVSCRTCHPHNGGPAGGEHVNGSASLNGDALVSAAGSEIVSFTYGAHLGTDVDGYEYSASSCTPTCHGEGIWGEKGDCAFCHGYPPNSTNNQHARGVSAANHDATAITPNHGECWFCHGVRDDGSSNPSVMGTGVLKGSYVYSWSSDHWNGQTTMNGNANANTADDAGYNTANGGCDTTACHGNDASHRVGSGHAASVALRDLGPGSCSTCHGTDGLRYYPDSGAQNGTVYPNRAGKHAGHVSIVANRNALGTTNGDTCVWCHPGGGHSGDPSSPPADLHDGAATHFRDIIGNADSGESVAQSVAVATLTCAGVNCHYNKPPPETEWYGTATGGCDYCHTYAGDYLPGSLPNAHDIHVDAWVDGGYGMAGIFCLDCHQDTGQYMPFGGRHQNGIVELTFAYLAVNNPTDGNEAAIAGTGPLAGAVKYGGGTSADYYSCAGLYCHGDFDDQAGLGGGNASNTPNWYNTIVDGACGTCHGDPAAANANLQAAPVTGNSGTLHPNHLDLDTTPEMNCSVCHRDVEVPSANGTYGDYMRHVDGQILMALNHINPANSFVKADYELSSATLNGVYGSYTCSNIKCHNGVTTPMWSDASIPGFACGDCHNDGTQQSPLPVWSLSVTGSHAAHANTDAVFTDCTKCHGAEAASYSATGGTNHQNLVVDLALPGTGAVYVDSPATDSGGVNHPQVGGPGDRIDNGTCSNVSCHGGGTPVWGGTGPIECGICHGKTLGTEDRSSWGITPDVQGSPPLTAGGGTGVYRVGKHQAHVDESSAATGDACDLCHIGAGSGSAGLHGDLRTQVSFHEAAGASAVYDSSTVPPTCSNLDAACHGTGQWDTNATPPCDFCHGYPPSSANNRHASGVSPVNHDSANIAPNHGECWFCHGVRDGGSNQPAVMGTSALKGSYIYSWTTDHRDGRTTMNGDANADSTDDAGYNTADGGCDTAFCHGNDATHRVGNGSAVSATLRDLGPGSCTACHGTDNFNYYPDGGTQNGTAYPNRAGRHAVHVFFIASRNALNSADGETCDWCHPSGGHTGDQYSLPADLHDGSATHFKDVIGNMDSGEVVAQGGTTGTVSCSGVDCHYNNAPPATEWYGGLSMGCGYCHVAYSPYTPGDLPGAHDIHCDDVADGGYGMNDWGYCMACHYTLFDYDHQDGVVQVLFDDPFGVFPDDGDATAVSNGGPLTGRVKYGGGSTNDYYSCTGIYCHGDFDDGGIGGGNAANAPNWFDTVNGAACGTCHGDTGGADQTHQALPVTGAMDTIHANHVDMDPGINVDCSVCHYTLDANNGTYGMNSVHADNMVQVSMRPAPSGSIPDTDYEGSTASVAGSYGLRTCSAVVCHNGVTTPVWSDTSSVACGSCHHDAAGVGSSPLPGWESSVSRSHPAHADTDGDYMDCAVCHLATAANYTATGGTNHQDLVVQIAPGGGSYSESLGGAGVNWTSGGDGVDDGTCSVASCHGGGSPVWGDPSSLVCGDCHGTGLNGAPVVTVSSTHVDADGSGGTYAAGACEHCHAGHVGLPGTVTIPLPPISWSNANMTATSMRSQLGINYVSHNGIAIGGTTTLVPASIRGLTTEAGICWGCHDSLATQVSEWGFNTKTNTTVAGMDVVWAAFPTQGDGTAESKNYGWIYDSTYSTRVTDWTTGHWMSAYDSLLKRRVASVHSANFDTVGQSGSVAANVVGTRRVRQGTAGNPYGDPSEPVLEDAGQIRCSYCHDVHGTFGPSGKPHLRGTWVGDPYPPELPPRNTYTYTKKVSNLSGNRPTPRALASSRDRGGYFIDQNSNSPTLHTAMDTIAETAGLCTLCHGTDIDTMDFYTSSSLWRFAPPGKNGHSNASLGGTRDAALISDLFTGSRYGDGMGMQLQTPRSPWVCDDYGNCDPNYPQAPLVMWSCESNCNNLVNSGWFNTIRTGTTSPMGGDFTNWYGIGTIGGINQAGAKAHNFTCSKCHSPHAAGLPALLTQNCIDPALGNFTINGFTGTNLIANNCHRKTNTTDGWHILAPGQ